MSKPIRTALYVCVSTSGHGQDVGLQLDELRQVAAQRGWTFTEFVDEGVSGSKRRRPALDRMMADARAGELDVMAVWRFDRFARDTRHLLTAMEEFRSLGVAFVSLLDRDLIRERMVAGVQRASAKGKHRGRPKVAMDLRPARALIREEPWLKDVAAILKLSRATLRRRRQEEGEWPVAREDDVAA